ncbi:Hydroxyproline O-arabinosyltransferase 1 [Camellia lanceoleosa]|uniref:Hydroxyproline O-arabinosyltransferase 1 n=1 Tax=Camellia lanceoleosa TaxID=1840588 RepID=A0ACC0HM70_9ERIC|nr:Hydroxyproline O-arabinosyltransferase 1 [Camellia lanceoleosa]
MRRRQKLDVNEPAHEQTEPSTTGHWEEKELVIRDGQAKLKANVFLASFDQRSDKAAGESACTALAAIIASWPQSNQDNTPTRAQFDRLIVKDSSEWRKLYDNQDLINQFPNKHFDIETVLQARLCPISILHEKSFIGFFGPEKFETLKGVLSFDQIWDEIKRNAKGDNDMPRIYIVSWNDHFFVLKVDVNAYYIIDTFGKRLFEGCNQAYILRYAYVVVSALHNVGNILYKDFMIQPLWDTKIGNKFIIHFTYGCDYDMKGKLTYGKIGEWRFDKRSYTTAWPPKNLPLPPPGVPESVVTLVKMVNEATANIPNWGS